MEKLLDNVKAYLAKENINPVKDSVKYLGIKEDFKHIDGNVISVHIVNFQIQFDTNNPYSEMDCFIAADFKSQKLLSITMPHHYKLIVSEKL